MGDDDFDIDLKVQSSNKESDATVDFITMTCFFCVPSTGTNPPTGYGDCYV